MTVKVRERHDTKEPAWQVDIKAMPAGALKAKRYRYTAPRSITSKSGTLRWGEQVRRQIESGETPPQSREARAKAITPADSGAPESAKPTPAAGTSERLRLTRRTGGRSMHWSAWTRSARRSRRGLLSSRLSWSAPVMSR